jgi:hypothetical protein
MIELAQISQIADRDKGNLPKSSESQKTMTIAQNINNDQSVSMVGEESTFKILEKFDNES